MIMFYTFVCILFSKICIRMSSMYSEVRVILAIKFFGKLESYPYRHKLPGYKLRVPNCNLL